MAARDVTMYLNLVWLVDLSRYPLCAMLYGTANCRNPGFGWIGATMTITDRMLTGAIANNPGNYHGDGEWRYSITQRTLYFSKAAAPDPRDQEPFFPLPSLNPDGSGRMERAFRNFIRRRWPPSRCAELERFAERKGWHLAMELKYGGGALEDHEAAEWQYVVNRELQRLAAEVRARIAELEATTLSGQSSASGE